MSVKKQKIDVLKRKNTKDKIYKRNLGKQKICKSKRKRLDAQKFRGGLM